MYVNLIYFVFVCVCFCVYVVAVWLVPDANRWGKRTSREGHICQRVRLLGRKGSVRCSSKDHSQFAKIQGRSVGGGTFFLAYFFGFSRNIVDPSTYVAFRYLFYIASKTEIEVIKGAQRNYRDSVYCFFHKCALLFWFSFASTVIVLDSGTLLSTNSIFAWSLIS